jgi:hypothetical protein
MYTVNIYAGMTGDYQVIRTDAPKELIEKQLQHNNELEEKCETIDNPYSLLEQKGYAVELVCSSDDSIDIYTIEIDFELDYYDYNKTK